MALLIYHKNTTVYRGKISIAEQGPCIADTLIDSKNGKKKQKGT